MIPIADIGNSPTTFALFDKEGKLAIRSTLATEPHVTEDQYAIQLFSIFQLNHIDRESVTGVIYGNAGLADGMLDRPEEATEPVKTVAATGTWAGDIVSYCRRSILRDQDLLPERLHLLYQKNTQARRRG